MKLASDRIMVPYSSDLVFIFKKTASETGGNGLLFTVYSHRQAVRSGFLFAGSGSNHGAYSYISKDFQQDGVGDGAV